MPGGIEERMNAGVTLPERPDVPWQGPQGQAGPRRPLVASIVGMDGCGKSSTFRGALKALAERIRIVGIGELVWSGGPGEPLQQRIDIPLSRSAHIIGRFAKNLRWRRLYKCIRLAVRFNIDPLVRHAVS